MEDFVLIARNGKNQSRVTGLYCFGHQVKRILVNNSAMSWGQDLELLTIGDDFNVI